MARGTRFGLLFPALLAAFLAVDTRPANAASERITVAGTQLLRGGRAWVPKGVVIVGLVAPPAALDGQYRQAHEHYGAAELDAAKRYGADLIRFQVSQPGNDAQSPIYDAAYADQLKEGIDLARARGFQVLVSMQSERPSGLDQKGMPSDATQRAWKVLAPRFANDPDVMLELFNEPAPFGSVPYTWQGWRDSTQALIDEIRGLGARNVLIADGMRWAHILEGAPPLHDPLGQVAYGVHPYFAPDFRSREGWDRYFGLFAATHPVLVTEWNAISKRRCFPRIPAVAADLLAYLREKRIGLVGWAFDLPGTLITDFSWTPTNYRGFQCGPDTDFGAGEMVRRYFAGDGLQN